MLSPFSLFNKCGGGGGAVPFRPIPSVGGGGGGGLSPFGGSISTGRWGGAVPFLNQWGSLFNQLGGGGGAVPFQSIQSVGGGGGAHVC